MKTSTNLFRIVRHESVKKDKNHVQTISTISVVVVDTGLFFSNVCLCDINPKK